jgi:hypothetical protein
LTALRPFTAFGGRDPASQRRPLQTSSGSPRTRLRDCCISGPKRKTRSPLSLSMNRASSYPWLPSALDSRRRSATRTPPHLLGLCSRPALR